MPGIEDQIALRLQAGAAPRDLISEGYKKSTVYKVLEGLRPNQTSSPPALLTVQTASDRSTYPPGAAAQVTFTVGNQSPIDLYVFQAGVRPEWVPPDQWIPTSVRKLVPARGSLSIRLTVPIPTEVEVGEKELQFGLQGQWVGPQSASPSSEVMWANPVIIRVQRPPSGIKVYLSHSVHDMSWVAKLEASLTDNGVATQVAANSEQGGAPHLVDAADILVAVVTEPVSLDAALNEAVHAKKRNKQVVLLRDQSLAHLMQPAVPGLQWIDLDFSLGKATILMYLFNELQRSIEQRAANRRKEFEDALGAIILGLGAVAAGIAIGRGKAPSA
jgi:hypothetical protein